MKFSNLSKWLAGTFVCRRCGRDVNVMSFGFGECICPDCYGGENPFLFFDGRYWLNRLMVRLLNSIEGTASAALIFFSSGSSHIIFENHKPRASQFPFETQ